jgi:hypothetical protein
MNLDIIHDKLSVVDSEKWGNLFLNSLPSGLLWCHCLLNYVASFMKIVSACAWNSLHENTHTTENYYIRYSSTMYSHHHQWYK